MRRTLPFLIAAGLLAGCPQSGGPKLAQLHVACAGKTLDGNSEPPDQGQACPAGSALTLSYDNDGNYGFVTIYAITRDNLVFYLPDSEQGDSVAIQTGKNIAVPGTFLIPAKTRDVMAIFSKDSLKAKDVAQHTREVTLLQMPGEKVRVRLSKEIGPVD